MIELLEGVAFVFGFLFLLITGFAFMVGLTVFYQSVGCKILDRLDRDREEVGK